MLGKTEPRSSISSLVMVAADVNVKPGILIAMGGKEGKAEEFLLVVQRPPTAQGDVTQHSSPWAAHGRG